MTFESTETQDGLINALKQLMADVIYNNKDNVGWSRVLHEIRMRTPFGRQRFCTTVDDELLCISLSYNNLFFIGAAIHEAETLGTLGINNVMNHYVARQKKREHLKEKFLDPEYVYKYGFWLIVLVFFITGILDPDVIRAIRAIKD